MLLTFKIGANPGIIFRCLPHKLVKEIRGQHGLGTLCPRFDFLFCQPWTGEILKSLRPVVFCLYLRTSLSLSLTMSGWSPHLAGGWDKVSPWVSICKMRTETAINQHGRLPVSPRDWLSFILDLCYLTILSVMGVRTIISILQMRKLGLTKGEGIV